MASTHPSAIFPTFAYSLPLSSPHGKNQRSRDPKQSDRETRQDVPRGSQHERACKRWAVSDARICTPVCRERERGGKGNARIDGNACLLRGRCMHHAMRGPETAVLAKHRSHSLWIGDACLTGLFFLFFSFLSCFFFYYSFCLYIGIVFEYIC